MLKRIMEELLSEMNEGTEKEVRVGRISKELVEELEVNKRNHHKEQQEIKNKIDAYIETIKAEHCVDIYNERKADLWEKIYDELNLTQEERGLSYTLKPVSHTVYRIEELEGEEVVAEPQTTH